MSRKLSDLDALTLESVTIKPTGANAISIKGTLTLRDPHEKVKPYLRQVHEIAMKDGLKELRVDLTALTFVNSSAIRLFIDWAVWLQREPDGKRYRLVFFTDPRITWQRTSFGALESMAGDVMEIRRG